MSTATYEAPVVTLRRPHAKQELFIRSPMKRRICRAGRRSGKTTAVGIIAVEAFLAKKRVLYATPTQEQVDAFWFEVKRSLRELIDRGHIYKNESLHILEFPGTKTRIRAKTAWNADTLRGDYADLLILDEWQLMDEDAWQIVGAPMLIDNNGDAVFVYTPPSLRSRSVSKARDPRHASKMFAAALKQPDYWGAFHFTSRDNPHVSREAIEAMGRDMTNLARRQELEAEDLDEVPGALWTRDLIQRTRVQHAPDVARIIVGVDPPGGATECGIVAVGIANDGHIYVLNDRSEACSPALWSAKALSLYLELEADAILGEQNYGGDMVEATVLNAAKDRGVTVRYRHVNATRGKAVRAEPIVALFEQGRAHIVGDQPALEDELVTWVPGTGAASPNRLDALVWAATGLTNTQVWTAI